MASKFHGGNNKKEKLLAMHYARYVAPHLMASFALTLYEKRPEMSVDEIADLCVDVNDLWNRSTVEGWDIVKNCSELLNIDMRSWIDVREHEKRTKKGGGRWKNILSMSV